jgi:DNA-binding transcriptional MerR regulator
MKRGGGRRLYRPSDVELLRGIQDLLDNKAYSIRGVQKILRESGVEAVKAVSKGSPAPTERAYEDTDAGSEVAGGVALSPAELRSLRGVIAELDACRIMLGGNGSPAGTRPQRSRRAAARG